MRYHILIIALTILSCKEKSDKNISYNRDQLNIEVSSKILVNSTPLSVEINLDERKQNMKASSIIDKHDIVKLQTTDDCLIGEISKVIIKGEKIFVFDSKIAKNLYCFDLRGKYLFKVGVLGEGPGEMDTPRDFDITDNHILIIDRQCRVFTYSLSGKYQSVFRLPFLTTQICALNDTSIFYYTGNITDSFKFYLTQVNGSFVKSFCFPIQSEFVGLYDIPQAFHKHEKEALFVKFLCDTIFIIANNQVKPNYVINFQNEYPDNVFRNKEELDKVYMDPDKYGKLFNMHLAATPQDLFFLSSNRGINCHFISKITGKHVFTKSINDDFLIGGLSPMFPVGSHSEYLIYPINMSYMITNFKKVFKEFKKNGLEKDFLNKYSELKALCDQSREDDNPALLLAKINPKIYEE